MPETSTRKTRTTNTRTAAPTTSSRSRQGKSTSRAKAAAAEKERAVARSARKPLIIPFLSKIKWNNLSAERRLDVVGVSLTLVGLLTFFSLMIPQGGKLSTLWVLTVTHLLGWGAFVLPVALMGVGLWLVMRRMEELPDLSLERALGIFLLYLNLLTWLHWAIDGGWDEVAAGQGGGYIGAFIKLILVALVGRYGTVTSLVAWVLISFSLTLDTSIYDMMVSVFSPVYDKLPAFLRGRLRDNAASTTASPQTASATNGSANGNGELPSDFLPIPDKRGASILKRPSGTNKQSESATVEAPSDPVIAVSLAENWILPGVQVILDPGIPTDQNVDLDNERSQVIETTLAALGAPGHVVEVQRGPTITQYGVEPDFVENRAGKTRVRVGKMAALADDLALALAVSRVRVQAPVPGRSYVGIEVPNTETSRVNLRDILESEVFQNVRSPLRIGLGKDVSGAPVVADLKAMPHLLIAGTTGSGKSVCVNTVLCSFLLYNSPADLRLMLIDPKRVELTGYNGIPHLLCPVIVDAERVVGALQWITREMDTRYRKFTQAGVRNIIDFNIKQTDEQQHLPHLVVVIDELADLMMLAPDETERCITRLAQLARATGIHLILATQRPSVDIITGLIKANFPARIAFAVASGVDSRVILDQPGAERLLGRGDMLFQSPDSGTPRRLQGAYVSDSEIQLLVDYWKYNASAPGIEKKPNGNNGMDTSLPIGVELHQIPLFEDLGGKKDPVMDEAIDLVRREGRASITMLQRRMRIGYTRAARLIEAMEEKGIIGPANSTSQIREILDYGPVAPPQDD